MSAAIGQPEKGSMRLSGDFAFESNGKTLKVQAKAKRKGGEVHWGCPEGVTITLHGTVKGEIKVLGKGLQKVYAKQAAEGRLTLVTKKGEQIYLTKQNPLQLTTLCKLLADSKVPGAAEAAAAAAGSGPAKRPSEAALQATKGEAPPRPSEVARASSTAAGGRGATTSKVAAARGTPRLSSTAEAPPPPKRPRQQEDPAAAPPPPGSKSGGQPGKPGLRLVVRGDDRGNKGPQQSSTKQDDEDVVILSTSTKKRPLEEKEYVWKDRQLLRIPVSSAAACTGITGFRQSDEEVEGLFVRFLYQDLQHVLEKDAELVGVEVVSDEELLQSLVDASADPAALRELVAAEPPTADAAVKLQDRVRSLTEASVASGRLSQEEASEMQNALQKKISCGFGTLHEEAALDAYERQTGRAVRERNAAFLKWALPEDPTAADPAPLPTAGNEIEGFKRRAATELSALVSGPEDASIKFPKELTRAERKCVHHLAENLGLVTRSHGQDPDRFVIVAKNESSLAAGGCGLINASCLPSPCRRPPPPLVQETDKPHSAPLTKPADPRERGQGAALLIVGFVDGTSEEAGRKLVVEMKHRMRKVYEPPPFRDTVQLCIYLRMLGCAEGDLVQCVRTGAPVERVSITRMRLEGEHDRGWREAVRPRLYRFAEAIYKFRQDDHLRYRFLASTTAERAAMIYAECDFLEPP